MAFNNGYPVTYPQLYQPFAQSYTPVQVQNQNLAPVQQNGIIWVSGEAGAKAYLVAPNSTVQLWDSESQTIYLKSADASGMPTMKVLDYTIRDQAKNVANSPVSVRPEDLSVYATKSEIEAISSEIAALKAQMHKLAPEV